MKEESKITFIVPVYNEGESIKSVLNSITSLVSQLEIYFEVIVINDGSTDGTQKIVQSFVQTCDSKIRIQLLQNATNRGYGYSLKKGVRNANSKYVVFFDGDGQHRIDEVLKLYSCLDDETDLVIGARNSDSSSPAWRKPGKYIVTKFAEYIAKSSFPDIFSGLRIWKRESFLKIEPLLPNGFSLSTTSTIAANIQDFSIKWVNVKMEKRNGKSSATPFDGFRILLLMLRLGILFAPLKVFFPISLFVGLFGFVLILTSYTTQGFSSLRGILALLFSLIIALQGLLVDQVSSLRRGENATRNV